MTRQVTRRRTGSTGAGYSDDANDSRLSGRRGRPARDDDEGEDRRTSSRRGRPARDDGDAGESRGRRRGGSDSARGAGHTSGGRGWASHKQNQAKTKRGFGSNPDEFRVAEEDTTYLIKMLEDEPFWSYCEHFINEIEEGKRSFTCGGDRCPLCDYGDNPRAYDLFNVAAWDPDANEGDGLWVAKFWRATPDPAGKVLSRAEELSEGRTPRALGDPDVYLAVSKSASKKKKGGRSFNEFQVDIVKERDLEEDYGAWPLTDTDLEELEEKMFDESVVPEASAKELRAAAEALDD